jgi:hypothetical protein
MIISLIGQTVTVKEHLMVKKRVALIATAIDCMKEDQMAPLMEMLMALPRN